jgi:hypothetical protein
MTNQGAVRQTRGEVQGARRVAALDQLVSFVIPVRNDARRLERCLASITKCDYPRVRIEIIVVDNGSSDESGSVARAAGARVLVAPGESVAALRNIGARQARGETLAFVDADHEIDPGWIRAATVTLLDPSVGIVGALYHAPADGTWVQRMYDALRARPAGRREVEWLGSGNMAVRRTVFERLDGFDSSLETCEDVDFTQRVRAGGWRVLSDERLRSVHLGDPPTLAALFFGELWRGRDNLRVSLRAPLSWRVLPSLAIPIVDLAAVVLAIVLAPLVGLAVGAGCLGILAALATLRAGRMLGRSRPSRAIEIGQAWLVACVYDVARALALVARAAHRLRRATSLTRTPAKWGVGPTSTK